MTTQTQAMATPTSSLLERVAGLKDVIAEGGDRAQELRRVPDETVEALIDGRDVPLHPAGAARR